MKTQSVINLVTNKKVSMKSSLGTCYNLKLRVKSKEESCIEFI